MTKKIVYKIISNSVKFEQNLEALIYITKDVLMLREKKLNSVDEAIETAIISETYDIGESDKEVDSIVSYIIDENPKALKDNNIYAHKFDFLFFNSIFINIFSLFEIYLNNLGKLCEEFEKNNIKIKDLKGDSTIDTIRKYFHLIFKIDSASKTEVLWKQINEYKSIRNSIVHKGNKLNLDKNKNYKSVKGFSKIKQHKIKYYGVEMNFELNNIEIIIDFKNVCEKYLRRLTKEIKKNYS